MTLQTSNSQIHSNQTNDTQVAPIVETEIYSIFDKKQKAAIICLVSIAATFSGFASNIYFPALPTIARDLSVSVELVNLTVTTYLIFQGIAPSLWGPVSDVKGRRIAYICTFTVFLCSCIGLALSKNYTSLVILRCLQSAGSASTIAIGSGVVGDVTTRAERGGYMGIFQAGLLVPVAVGPVIGGALSDALGWRAIFWFLAIYSGIFLVALALLLPETLRCIVANGSVVPSNPINRLPLRAYQELTTSQWDKSTVSSLPPHKHIDITGPLRILMSKQAAPIIVFVAVYYTIWQMSITAMSTLFEARYHLNETQVGLTFIANGVGCIIGTMVTGKILDIDFRRVKDKHMKHIGNTNPAVDTEPARSENESASFPLEQARLRLVPFFCLVQCLSTILFGWSIQFSSQVHIAVPITSTFFTGWTAISTQSVAMTYLVDIFSDRSAAASASLNLARCLLAAGGTSVVMPMINGIGVGWTFSVCVLIQCLAFACLVLQWKFGARWRAQSRENEAGEHSK